MTPATIVLAWEIAATVVVLVFLAAAWTLWVYRLPQKGQRDAFQDMQVINDNASHMHIAQQKVIKQLGDLASLKPIVEVPTGPPIFVDKEKHQISGNGRLGEFERPVLTTPAEDI